MKQVERPSLKNVAPVAGAEVTKKDGGISVPQDIKAVDNNGFVKINEVNDMAKLNVFKPIITPVVSNNFLRVGKPIRREYSFPVTAIKFLSLRFKTRDVKDLIVNKMIQIEKDKLLQKGLTDDQIINDAQIAFFYRLIQDVTYAKNKEKELMLILNKECVVDTTPIDPNDMYRNGELDPSFRIIKNAIPQFLKNLCYGEYSIKHYGDELVLVLDVNKVMSFVVLPVIVAGDDNFNLYSNIELGESIATGPYINIALTVNCVDQDTTAELKIYEDQFVCGRFQFTHERFVNALVGHYDKNHAYVVAKPMDTGIGLDDKGGFDTGEPEATTAKPLTFLNENANIIFVRTADIAMQPSGAEAIRNQCAGLPNATPYITMPLIKLPKEKYSKNFKSTGNPLLDGLINQSSKVEAIDVKAVMGTFRRLIDERVYSFNVGTTHGNSIAILPNFRTLAAVALLGTASLDNTDKLPKIDVADNGTSIAILLSV